MRYNAILILATVFLFENLAAQRKTSLAYAITASTNNANQGWTEVKVVNLSTGILQENIFESSKVYDVFDARSNKKLNIDAQRVAANDAPLATFSAACAFDRKHNRLYYTPMGINQLRYVDLNTNTPKFFYYSNESFGVVKDLSDAANHITRMTFGADGNGYALSNDANHLLQFTTGKKAVATDMGSLNDDAANAGISIHNQCSGWGGDMVADTDGNLYVVAASHAVFKVSLVDKVAKYLGHIEGLPNNFTTNGAAVDDDGKLVVSSANASNAYYQVDMNTLKASLYSTVGNVFTTADLASGNLLNQKEISKSLPATMLEQPLTVSKISVYPNPVTDGVVNVSFDKLVKGRYNVQVIDQNGSIVYQKAIITSVKGQLERIDMEAAVSKGVYMVKVVGENKKEIQTTKIIVQ